MSAQDRTLEQYHQLMQLNAASHLIRAARSLGVIAELREGQRTLEQLREALSLGSASSTLMLLDALVAIGIVEQYGDDYALSRAAHLLCQYDDDLGDARWQQLAALVRGDRPRQHHDDQRHFDHLAATQWIHTPAAMEAAEILNIGGQGEIQGPRILDLGCGSAVWSCAMAYRDPQATVTAVDNQAALAAAESTAQSIGLSERFQVVVADPLDAELQPDQFDWVLIAQRLSCHGSEAAQRLLEQGRRFAKPGGRVVVIDLVRMPARANLTDCVESLTLQMETREGSIRSLEQLQGAMQQAGLVDFQFALMSKSRAKLGLAVATRPAEA